MNGTKLYEKCSSVSVWCIVDVIEEFSQYSDLIRELYTASDSDTILLLIHSTGGRVDVGRSIINAMKESSAFVHCMVEGPCYSMASIIALSGDKLSLRENTFLMFHNYSTIMSGKGNEIGNAHTAKDKHFTQLFISQCQPFLSSGECKKVLSGEDFYVYSDESALDKRIKKHFK